MRHLTPHPDGPQRRSAPRAHRSFARSALRVLRALGTLPMAALHRSTLAMLAMAAFASTAGAQWSTTYEQFYLQAEHNWTFRDRYQGADRMFNAFDYGHAILYETLWTKPNAPASELEEREYDYLTRKVLVKPPRIPLEEGAIEIAYARLVPEAKAMFEWAHILHRQMYDVLADDRLDPARRDAEMARLLAYYRTRPDVAFSSRPKSMVLMQEQPYSLAFREKYPKFNGLIWAYHWLQVGLYEPLLVATTPDARQAAVRGTVARFWQMLGDAPRTMPHQMPMTAAIAPTFAARYPEAAIIFDNLHSMHDVVSDILANPKVPRTRKREEILRAARLYRDDTSYVMPVEAWLTMSREMGIENMGGPSVGFLPELPTPTVTYGAVMQHDDRTGRMTGMKTGSATGPGHDHGSAATTTDSARPGARADSAPAAVDHAAMGHGAPPASDTARASSDSALLRALSSVHERMLADTTIRRRALADTALRRMMIELLPHLGEDRRSETERMLRDTLGVPARRPSRPAARPAPAAGAHPATNPPKPPPKPDPHAGHAPPPPAPPPADPVR